MKIEINTAQNVNITYKQAGLFNRICAFCIDYFFMACIFSFAVFLLRLFGTPGRERNIIMLILFILLMCYQFLFEFFFNGQSPGKMLLRLRVIKADGRKLTFWDCLLRWVLRLIDITISGGTVAMISIIVSPKMQRLGDLAANTIVICEAPVSSQHIHSEEIPEDYQAVFPQVAMLTDRDIAIIREVLKEAETTGEYKLLAPLALRIKEITAIETKMNNLNFTQTVLRDYRHLTENN